MAIIKRGGNAILIVSCKILKSAYHTLLTQARCQIMVRTTNSWPNFFTLLTHVKAELIFNWAFHSRLDDLRRITSMDHISKENTKLGRRWLTRGCVKELKSEGKQSSWKRQLPFLLYLSLSASNPQQGPKIVEDLTRVVALAFGLNLISRKW